MEEEAVPGGVKRARFKMSTRIVKSLSGVEVPMAIWLSKFG